MLRWLAASIALSALVAHSGTVAFTGRLAEVNDINAWLGRSLYAADPEFAGRIAEFRIYSIALTPPQVELAFEAGPDAAFLPH